MSYIGPGDDLDLVEIYCPECGELFWGMWGDETCNKPRCGERFRLRRVCQNIEFERSLKKLIKEHRDG